MYYKEGEAIQERSDFYIMCPLDWFTKCLPLGKRRLYFVTFQPYQANKKYLKCAARTSMLADFLRKQAKVAFYIVREHCKSQKPHFHAIVFATSQQVELIKNCKFSSVHIQRSTSKVTKNKYPWNGRFDPSIHPEVCNAADSNYEHAFKWSHTHIAAQHKRLWLETLRSNRLLARLPKFSIYYDDMLRLSRYISKESPSALYKDYQFFIP